MLVHSESRGRGRDQGGAIDVWGEDQHSNCSLDLNKPKSLHHAERLMPNAVASISGMDVMRASLTAGTEFNC